jgi:hypothetical protein
MIKANFPTRTAEGALHWMLNHEMLVRKTSKDPETYATVQGFILSDQLREMIGSNLVKLVSKATRSKGGRAVRVSVRDAFLAATMASVLEMTSVVLSDAEMTRCANIIFSLLPIRRLEDAGLADRPLRAIARDLSSVRTLQGMFGPTR